MADPVPDRRRRTFGPVVLLGLAGAGLAALAAGKAWYHEDASTPQAFGSVVKAAPAMAAIALVALAAWGVVLVTRGRFRRVIAGLAVLAGAGSIAAGVGERVTMSHGAGHWTAWPWFALLGAVVTTVAALFAVRLATYWPEMGRKYDAPTGAAQPAVPLEEQSSLELWKSIGEGHDPTVDGTE